MPPHRVAQIDLTFKIVLPGGRIGVLEIRHEHVRAGVQRVDDHLAIDRSGDFDAPVEQVRGNRRHLPIRLADRPPSPAENRAFSRRRFPAGARAVAPAVPGGAVRTSWPDLVRNGSGFRTQNLGFDVGNGDGAAVVMKPMICLAGNRPATDEFLPTRSNRTTCPDWTDSGCPCIGELRCTSPRTAISRRI